jgi:Protein of unknown function DUF262
MRRQNFQTVSWFYDIFKRDLLNLDPPYQRRSVWNQDFKDFFIDTLLLNYPAPALFMYEEINQNGTANYNVVDGKQRLSTIFDFVENKFPISETASLNELRGKYFDEIDKDLKIKFWNYSFLVEYLPTSDESIINNIFDRINRNVARLTSQELRHAKYSGVFITTVEEITDIVNEKFNNSMPRIAQQSRKQMKDVELFAQILLMLEEGPKSYNSDELDIAFNNRDTEWNEMESVKSLFLETIEVIAQILKIDYDNVIKYSRLSNQADYYSLIGAISENIKNNVIFTPEKYLKNLKLFIDSIEDEQLRLIDPDIESYYQNARVATNRTSARRERVRILKLYLDK